MEDAFDMWYGSLILEDKDRVEPLHVERFFTLIDGILDRLNKAEYPLVFSHGHISEPGEGVHQTIHRYADVVLRFTAAYDCMGKYTQCPDHIDWEHCKETNCQFEQVKIHGRGVNIHIDCMIQKQESLV